MSTMFMTRKSLQTNIM